ncbi:MAG: fumarylacetoacetate hydrolase family protein [Alistipes sp.]|nr:fumarylacetoacetate hydrolase family protein [Alistipes sp.]
MKLICIDNALSSGSDLYLTVRSDSSVLRNNDDFYMPSFSHDMRCTVGYMLRVTRLAKCMTEKFASRCYDAVGVAVAFTAQDVVERNCALGRPCDEAYCFDKSIALSPDSVAPDAMGEGELQIKIGNSQCNIKLSDLYISLDKALSKASELLTLKMGDIVYIASTEPFTPHIGDRVEVSMNGAEMLNFEVK